MTAARYNDWYHALYSESSTFYNSEEFAQEKVKAIKLRIIDHVDQGVTN